MIPNQFWIHKNHLCAFKALRRVKQHGKSLHLVCTGATCDYRSPHHFDELVAYLREHDLEDCVHILGLIPRSDQIQILRRSAIIIQPSLFEGWSTVVEDARAFGKRLIASNLSVHREQNVDDAQYFDPRGPDMLADLLLSELHSLAVGPDVDREVANRRIHKQRAESFARAFIEIGRETASAR
jgi:glycosyltransferase involved in cell wall biosynthesis